MYVSDDTFEITDDKTAPVEGDRECKFTTVERPIESCTKFTLKRDNSRFTNHPGRAGYTLHHERRYARNPCY